MHFPIAEPYWRNPKCCSPGHFRIALAWETSDRDHGYYRAAGCISKPLVDLARQYHVLPVAIVLNLPERVCADRNRDRADRNFGPHVVRNQSQELRRSLKGLEREGFRHVQILNTEEEINAAAIEWQPLWNNRKFDHGPFDIIGDVHGCFAELTEFLQRLGYMVTRDVDQYRATPPDGRKVAFVGDLVDRGPNVVEVLRLVMAWRSPARRFAFPATTM